MAQNDLNHLILQPGELHIVMAMLRTINQCMHISGIDMCWIQSELYGPFTVKQILHGNHIKRGEKAHMITLQAWFALYLSMAFLKLCQNCTSVLRIYQEKLLKHSERARKRKIESPPVLHLRHQFLKSH